MRNVPVLLAVRLAIRIALALAAALAVGCCTALAGSSKQAGKAEDFPKYLKELNLPALLGAELTRMCRDEADAAACGEVADRLLAESRFDQVVSLAGALKCQNADVAATAAIIKCRGLYGAGRYSEAVALLDSLVATMPPEEKLLDAVGLRAMCYYNLGRSSEALINLRALDARVRLPARSGHPVWLARCEESSGDLDRAVKLYEEAWKAGSSAAALGLARCHLRRGKTEAFLGLCKEAAKRGVAFPSSEACDLAVALGDVAPELWHPLMKSVVGDTLLDVDARPELVASVMRLSELGENVAPYCDALLGRARMPAVRNSLRYARIMGQREDAGKADSLAALAAEISEPLLKLRSVAGAVGVAPERASDLVRGLGSGIGQVLGILKPDDRLALCSILIEGGAKDVASVELKAMLGGLSAGYDDEAMAEIASLLEAAGDIEAALGVYDLVAGSQVLSSSSLDCERRAFLARHLARPEIDIAKEVEKIAKKGASDLELGDLFMEKLKDYERASAYYGKVLEAVPKGVSPDAVKLKLARALGLASFDAPSGMAGEVSPDQRRGDAVGHLASIAQSGAVKPDEVIAAVKLSTNWFEADHARTAQIAGAIAQRDDLTSGSLYGAAELVYGVFIRGNLDYYERCAALLGRVATDFPTSKQALPATLALARLKVGAGDYAGARAVYETCAAKARDPLLAGLSNGGIGECYLYAGGLSDAVGYLEQGKSWRTLFESAQTHDLLGRADSSLVRYRALLARPVPAHAMSRMRLRLALVQAASGRMDLAFEALDSPLPGVREGLADSRQVLAAYALGRRGYSRLGVGVLARIAASASSAACEGAIHAARLVGDSDPEDASALLEAAAASDIIEEYSLMLDRARYACSAPAPGPWLDAARRFRSRFPLDGRSSAELDVRRALVLVDQASADTMSADVDSLLAAAGGHPMAAKLLYGKGIGLLVRGDYSGARQAFGSIVTDYWNSGLYRDACFKLGSTYYLMERYDSSSIYFALAALADNPALARDALFNRGLALEEIGAFRLAADVYGTLAARFPFSDQFERALVRRGYCLQSDGRPVEAVVVYKGCLRYANSSETQAELIYWIGESLSTMGDHAQAACEFLRVGFLYPSEQAWAGTAAFMAGAECEKAGLRDHAIAIYKQNVRRFGKASDWGRASDERLAELLSADSPPAETTRQGPAQGEAAPE